MGRFLNLNVNQGVIRAKSFQNTTDLQMVRDAESIRKNEEDPFKIDDPVTLFLSHFHDKLLFL